MLRDSPNNPDIHQELGQLLHREGQTKEAIAHYQKAMELRGEPIHLWYYRNLGEAMIRNENPNSNGHNIVESQL
ncbi:tetratricopeptide repeat protein [Lyngbya sp. CCY1209]|uniref:tetratricopeptide repeat protein n=1 Tax=Lyngbya sp. CCY1209 TaxID=2886103 RepID=UPI002D216317|nr:tetratricopeptide repeat protein [Lyngbya sp. CCY1209]MEB3886996.1 tetratricopeptide repeat protein [Lyngbya sp. CCY1209]